MLVSFLSPRLGLYGLLAILTVNFFALILGFSKSDIEKGLFGYNAMFLGFTLGFTYVSNSTFYFFFAVSMLMLLLITVWIKALMAKHLLPYLSFPFLITYWIVAVSSPSLENLMLNESYVYLLNHNAILATSKIHQFSHIFNEIQLPQIALSYFKTLAAGFFQTSVLSGMIIALALLSVSRIAFSLTIIGFSSAYLFYGIFGADISDLNHFLVGANFIFMSIALGCFYVIPNKNSYLGVFILSPVLVLVLIFFTRIMAVFKLNAYTLPYVVLTLVVLLALQHRWFQKFITLVSLQLYSAEKLIYKHLNSVQRFKNSNFAKIQLPFWGQWFVSQSHDGTVTHLGHWSKAFDFVIKSDDQTFKNSGYNLNDYYCFNKPVLAPLDGYIFNIYNNVKDNEIGENNTEMNWGNTVIINHLNGLYSQISHLKKDSFNFKIGDFVTKGSVIASCGNSGRSAEPHIHFQLQNSPQLGEKTLYYPIAYYILHKENNTIFKSFEIPQKDDIISNINTTKILTDSFKFMPDQILNFKNTKTNEIIEWKILTDAYNRSYIYCKKTKSYAYFVNDGTMFYFFDFEGNKKSLLFKFYLAAYRQILGYYENITIDDQVPINFFNNNFMLVVQDFIAPFYIFTKAKFHSTFSFADNPNEPEVIKISSNIMVTALNKKLNNYNFEINIQNSKIYTFKFSNSNITEEYICA